MGSTTATRSRALPAHEQARDQEQARLIDHAFHEALRLLKKHGASLGTLATALLEKETLVRSELEHMLACVAAESNSSETVGTPRGVELVDQG